MKRYSPTSPGQRHYQPVGKEDCSDEGPEKTLTEYLNKNAGRNNDGKITVRGQGSGNKRLYRQIDFKRDKDGVPASVERIEYDPNRSARIALLHYADGEKRYILAPRELEVGDTVQSGPDAPVRPGNALPLEEIPLGAFVHNIEVKPGSGGKLSRSAGTQSQLASKDQGYALIHLPSGQGRKINLQCRASIGQVSNIEHFNRELGKAGQNRYRNRRPITRGMARNPVDHPRGGGEGRIKGGHPYSPNGRITVGQKTRNNKRTDKFVIRDIRE
ncbi:MAG: 50S ribosomal protein L2 [bacterium]